MTSLLVYILFLSAYFVPGSVFVRPEYLVVVVLAVLSIFRYGKLICKLINREIWLFFLLIVFAATSLMVQIFFGVGFIYRDFMIIFRYIVYLLAILSGIYVAKNVGPKTYLMFFILVIVIVSISISFIQYFNVFGLNKIMIPVYSAKYVTLITGESWRRIIGTIGNANYWGLWMAFCFVATIYYVVIERNILAMFLIVPIFLSIVMTGSRTALISCFCGTVAGFCVKTSKDSAKKILSVFILFGFVGILFYGYTFFTSKYYDNQSRFDVKNIHTLEMRIDYWINGVESVLTKPYQILTGQGPDKSAKSTFGDNIYFRIFRDYGLISLIIFLNILVTFYRQIKIGISDSPPELTGFFIVAQMTFITFVVFDLAADSWFNVRLLIPLLFGYGFLITRRHIHLHSL